MGWLDKLLPWNKQKSNMSYANMLSGMTPIYSSFGNDIYVSDVVRQSIKCIVDEIVKLRPMHIVNNEPCIGQTSLRYLLERPNEMMTKADFLEKITWNLLMNYNVYIIPTYTEWIDPRTKKANRHYTGLYPVYPTTVEFLQDDSNTLYIKMIFQNMNYEITMPYKDVIHIRYEYSVNDVLGGDISGNPDRRALLRTLKLNESMLNGVEKAMNQSYLVNGIVKYHGQIKKDSIEKDLREFEQKLKNSESGMMPLDDGSDYIDITRNIKMVDSDTLEFIDSKILRTFGVSLPILSGDYTKQQYEAFYQKTLEPIIIKLGQAFTKALFTDRELSYGNEIKFYPKDLVFMTTNETLEMIRLLGDAGGLYLNEARTSLGLQPLPELAGIRMQSLNYVNSDIADKYQINMSTGKKGTSLLDDEDLDNEDDEV